MNKKKLTITINGVAYPCSTTMGAMLRFKEETGREITEMDGSIADLCRFLWCCVVSASNREGKKLDMDFITFADSIDAETLTEWAAPLMEEAAKAKKEDSAEKKSL